MNAVAFLQLKGIRTRSGDLHKPITLTEGELIDFLDEYFARKIMVYRRLQEQFKDSGCGTCKKAIENLEREYDGYILKYSL